MMLYNVYMHRCIADDEIKFTKLHTIVTVTPYVNNIRTVEYFQKQNIPICENMLCCI